MSFINQTNLSSYKILNTFILLQHVEEIWFLFQQKPKAARILYLQMIDNWSLNT